MENSSKFKCQENELINMKYYLIALFLAIVFGIDTLRATNNIEKVGAGVLAVVFGIVGFALILYNYFRPKTK